MESSPASYTQSPKHIKFHLKTRPCNLTGDFSCFQERLLYVCAPLDFRRVLSNTGLLQEQVSPTNSEMLEKSVDNAPNPHIELLIPEIFGYTLTQRE